MQLKKLIEKSNFFQNAIESVEILIIDHEEDFLKPTLNLLKERKIQIANQISTVTLNIDTQHEEITRLSHV